jgi:pyruvate,water dikinase
LTRESERGSQLLQAFEELTCRFLDIAYDQQRLHDRPESLLRTLLELAKRSADDGGRARRPVERATSCQQRLLAAVGPEREAEAWEMIEVGRVSWKLRDDDNLLVARLESQLLRALEVAADRLRQRGRLAGEGHPTESAIEAILQGLRDPSSGPIVLESAARQQAAGSPQATSGASPRQLVGQPASPGVATGTVRCIRCRDDLSEFRHGEVLVCDAIQPTMTHLVPLASAIVERRGGMLIHGAIIARELGIPCVNGVRRAADLLGNGDLVTVDGFLGIVTVGAADFDLELRLGNP